MANTLSWLTLPSVNPVVADLLNNPLSLDPLMANTLGNPPMAKPFVDPLTVTPTPGALMAIISTPDPKRARGVMIHYCVRKSVRVFFFGYPAHQAKAVVMGKVGRPRGFVFP